MDDEASEVLEENLMSDDAHDEVSSTDEQKSTEE